MRHVERGHPHLRLMAAPSRSPLRLLPPSAPQATRRYVHRLAQLQVMLNRERREFYWGLVAGFCIAMVVAIALR